MATDGTAGADFMTGGQGADTLNGLGGNDRLNGNPGADTLNGGDGDDLIYDGILWFSGSSYTHESDQFSDILNGGNGDDQLFGYIGDSFIGGAGFDRMTVSLNSFSGGLTIDMRIVEAGGTINIPSINNTGSGYIVVPNGAQISGIEQVVSASLTMGADTFWGTSSADQVDGYTGDDTIRGMGGDDVLVGGGGVNTLDGGDGNDRLGALTDGTNTLLGGAGDDIGIVVSGDSFDGGAGLDTVSITSNGGIYDLTALDGGGTATIDGGTLSNVERVTLTAMSGNMTFTGSDLAETVTTYSGVLNAAGGGGDDVLTGAFIGATDDVLRGDGGNDTLNGNGGQDSLDGDIGNDTLNGGDGDDVLLGEHVMLFSTLASSGNDTLNGGAGDDIVFGGAGTDTLNGGDGDDRLFQMGGRGGAFANLAMQTSVWDWGADVMNGGAGHDEAWWNFANMATGVNFTFVAVNLVSSFTGANGEFLGSITGIEDVTIVGGNGADHITGGDGNDAIAGGGGENVLNGGAGNDNLIGSLDDADTLIGGTGNDSFDISTLKTTIVEYAGEGNDTVFLHGPFGRSWDMDADLPNIEQLYFIGPEPGAVTVTTSILGSTVGSGSGADTLIGRDGNDSLDGGSGDDILFGGGGTDSLSGGAGVDHMTGGAGDDFYTVDNVDDVVIEDAAGGYDRVQIFTTPGVSVFAYTLAANVEDAIISVANAFTLIGNAENNSFSTSYSEQTLTLYGLGGDDTLHGGYGDDVLEGGAGTDFINGETGIDTVSAANDIAGVTIHLAGAWGQDGWGTYDTLVGNSLGNTIAGGGGDDWIVGLEGDDVLEGGAGVNVLSGGTGIDLASYASATAPLWVNMAAGVYSASGVWDVFFESIEGVRGGSGNDNLFGNTADNRLEGGAGDDALIGDLGNDTLVGGAGSDWIVAGDGNDRLIGGDGVDVLTGGAGADIFDLGIAAGWDVAFDFNTAEDRFSLGGAVFSGFLTVDADGDGQTDDTLLGYVGGNFVALNVSGLTLQQWNALVGAPSGAGSLGEKLIADAGSETLPVVTDGESSFSHGFGGSWDAGIDAAMRGFRPENPFFLHDGQGEWGPLAA